jgi:hypothetical protein
VVVDCALQNLPERRYALAAVASLSDPDRSPEFHSRTDVTPMRPIVRAPNGT